MIKRCVAAMLALEVCLAVLSVPAVAAVSPRASGVVFVRQRLGREYGDGHARLWTMDADGTQLRSLLGSAATGNDYDPAWSPDGSEVAFSHHERHSSPGEIVTVGINGLHATHLSPVWLDATGPTWSPDGTQIAFSGARVGANGRPASAQIWVVDSDGANLHVLTRGKHDHLDPAWSPAGGKIAYERRHWGRRDRTGNIYVKGLDKGDGVDITHVPTGHEAFSPDWSPDGTSLLYGTLRSSVSPFGTQLWTANADGSNPQLVRSRHDFSFDLSAVWAPGAKELLVSEQDDSRRGFWAHLLLMDVSGHHVRTLLGHNNEFFLQPDWTA